jgi:hypothetical protein
MSIASCFIGWLERTGLPVEIAVEKVQPDHVSFGLTSWPNLKGTLGNTGIDIYAMREGDCWDILWCNDLAARKVEDGWVCWWCLDAAEKGLCPQPPRYSTPEGLWIAHTFEAFRKWILEELAGAEGVGYWGDDGVTWAGLVFDPSVREKSGSDGAVEIIRRISSATPSTH